MISNFGTHDAIKRQEDLKIIMGSPEYKSIVPLPYGNYSTENCGKKIKAASGKKDFNQFVKKYEGFLNHYIVIEKGELDKFYPLATTLNNSEVISGYTDYILVGDKRIKTEGKTVVLPAIAFDELIAKNIHPSSVILDIAKLLLNDSEISVCPDWAHEQKYNTASEIALKNKIATCEGELKLLEIERDKNINDLDEEQMYKHLLSGTGKSLEKAVSKAFKRLGYEVDTFDTGDNEIDLIVRLNNDQVFIIEVEGKDKKAISGEKHNQLLGNVKIYEEADDDIICHGVIIGNKEINIEPCDREGSYFTQACVARSVISNYSLVRSPDLFNIIKAIETMDVLQLTQARDVITTLLLESSGLLSLYARWLEVMQKAPKV